MMNLLLTCWRLALGLLVASLAALPAQAAEEFLEPEKAFAVEARLEGADTVVWTVRAAPGYYLYRDRFQVNAADATVVAAVDLPHGQVKYDENLQREVETLRGAVEVRAKLASGPAQALLTLGLQGCADAGLCYPPQESQWRAGLPGLGGDGRVVAVKAGLPGSAGAGESGISTAGASGGVLGASAGAGSEGGGGDGASEAAGGLAERTLAGGSWWKVVAVFWGLGLLLSLTPCVLPMLPILSAILAGEGPVGRRRGLALAGAYSLGMACVYALLGVAAGLAGEGLAAWLQKPAVVAGFALLLLALALAMFDVYELRLPLALTEHLDGLGRRLPGGRLAGVFLMGGLSALVVSPCVSAPLAGALVFLSRSGDVWRAASALFALGLGMCLPLLLLGASAGHWLPKSGSWMNAVKRFFGLLLVGVAIWVAQPVLGAWVLLAWGGLLLLGGFMLRPFDPHPHSGAPRVALQRAAGLALLAWGVLLLAGAAAGGRDPLQPLAGLGARAGSESAAPSLPFRPVRSEEDLDQVLRSAQGPVVLDFYADWCVSCKEMEKFTFSDPGVARRLGAATLLKADVTANNAADRALLRRFGLFGPPGTLFFNAQGQEISEARLVGYQNVQDFEKTLQRAGL